MSDSKASGFDGFELLFAQESVEDLDQRHEALVEALSVFFRNIDRLNRNATLYHFGHSSVEGLKERLAQDLETIFNLTSSFTVEVQPFELFIFDRCIFEHQNLDSHYLFRMFQDGVRSLTMRKGLTQTELLRFCQLFSFDLSRPDMFEDDVVTLIWNESFQHISVESNDLIMSDESVEQNHHNSIGQLLEAIHAQANQPLGPRSARYSQLDLRAYRYTRNDLSLLHFDNLELSPEGRAKFERLLQSNVRERFEKFVEILFQIHLQFSESNSGRSERIAVLFDRIADAMLEASDFGELERLVRKLNVLSSAEGPDQASYTLAVEYILEHWTQDKFLQRVLEPLFSFNEKVLPSCLGILSKLRVSATPALIRCACQMTEPRFRAEIWEIVRQNLSSYSIQLARNLVDVPLPVAREIIALLVDETEAADLARLLLNGLRNPEAVVRLETVAAVENVDSDQATTLLLRTLHDEDSMVRGKGLHMLARLATPLAVRPASDIIQSDLFSTFSLDEKRRFFVTFVLCGGDLNEWKSKVSARALIESVDKTELKHCAFVALAVAMDPDVTGLANDVVQRNKASIVTDAARWALQHIRCSREERTRQLYAIFYSSKLVESRTDTV